MLITESSTPPQVRCGDSLQVSPQARVDRQELGFLGALPLQQLLGGAPQQQGAGYRAVAPPAARRGSVRLRRRLHNLLRCRGLPAPAHVSRLLCSACVPCVQCVEQVSDDSHWSTHPRPSGGTGTPRLKATDSQNKST